MRLLIAIPALDYIHSEFVQCLLDLTEKLRSEGITFKVKLLTGTLVYVARDKLAKLAVNENYTHVLWLDADMIFTPDLVDDLMFSGRSFVCGIFHGRRKPHLSCLFTTLNEDGSFTRFEKYPSNTFEIAGCGFGGVLMETGIIKEILLANGGTAFLPMAKFGEDLAFCLRAKRLGIKMYGEPGAVLGHIGHEPIYPVDRERYLAEIGLEGGEPNA